MVAVVVDPGNGIHAVVHVIYVASIRIHTHAYAGSPSHFGTTLLPFTRNAGKTAPKVFEKRKTLTLPLDLSPFVPSFL